MLDLDTLDFVKGGGFVTVVCQDAATEAVLMVARADREALERTLASGEMHYHSRTRGLWRKGATSGHVQRVVSLTPDCDGDAVLARVEPAGPACHTGAMSCFCVEMTRKRETEKTGEVFERLAGVIAERGAALPLCEGVRPTYTQRLLLDRNLRLKKLGEEVAELVVACADDDRARAVEEGGDVIYHLLVALAAIGVSLDDVATVLEARAR